MQWRRFLVEESGKSRGFGLRYGYYFETMHNYFKEELWHLIRLKVWVI